MVLACAGIIVVEEPNLAGEISDLHTAAFGFIRSLSMTEYKIKRRIEDSSCEAYGYVINGMLAGFFFLHSTGTFGLKLIDSFCVAPWKQGKGIGSQMLQFILDKYSFHDFHLTVAAKNDPARSLYRKFGFNNTDKVTMRREVT